MPTRHSRRLPGSARRTLTSPAIGICWRRGAPEYPTPNVTRLRRQCPSDACAACLYGPPATVPRRHGCGCASEKWRLGVDAAAGPTGDEAKSVSMKSDRRQREVRASRP